MLRYVVSRWTVVAQLSFLFSRSYSIIISCTFRVFVYSTSDFSVMHLFSFSFSYLHWKFLFLNFENYFAKNILVVEIFVGVDDKRWIDFWLTMFLQWHSFYSFPPKFCLKLHQLCILRCCQILSILLECLYECILKCMYRFLKCVPLFLSFY